MTNFEYIKNNLTELDIAHLIYPESGGNDLFSDKILAAWSNWSVSGFPNKGNMSKEYDDIKEDPSIWAWEKWSYPDHTWRKKGRNSIVSILVWLSKQYDEKDWEDLD